MSQVKIPKETKLFTFSHTKTSAFKLCPRKYELHYEKNLRPVVKDIKLAEGSIVHSALEMHYKGADDNTVMKEVRAYEIDYTTKSRKALADKIISEEEFFKHASRIEIMHRVIQRYLYFAPQIDREYKFTDVEKEFGDTSIVNGAIDVGKIDALAEGVIDKQLYVVEHKYVIGVDASLMELDQQITNYALVVYKLTGKIPVVLYNVILKPLYRLKKNETLLQFSERMREVIGEMPREDLIYRPKFTRSQRQLDLYVEELNGLIPQMQQKSYRYRNVGRHCKQFCPFMKICMFEDANIIKTEFINSEEYNIVHEEPSEDTEHTV